MTDVVVVGGGAMGLATAWHLALRARVVLLERFDAGHDRGASHGDERVFRYLYDEDFYVQMAVAADEGWQRLERDSGRSLFFRTASLHHGSDDELAAMEAAARRNDVAVEMIDPDRAMKRWPGMRFTTDVLSQPTAGWVAAADTLGALAELATAAGADLRFGTPVTRIEPAGASDARARDRGGNDNARGGGNDVRADATGGASNVRAGTGGDGNVRAGTAVGSGSGSDRSGGVGGEGVVVSTSGETFEADVVVVTAGAWSDPMLSSLVELPPLLTTEEHVFFFRPVEDRMSWPTWMHEADLVRYGLPTPDGLYKIGEHHTGDPVTGDDRTFVTDQVRIERMADYVRDWMPGLVPEVLRTKTCLYTSTPTHDFVLDRQGPIVVGAGFAGHGFKFVPEIGRRLATLALA